MNKHTPTPWRIELRYGGNSTGDSMVIGANDYFVCDNVSYYPDDQAFIVRAVNAHDALVEALRKIANLSESDCEKYVAKADSIACEVLAQLDIPLKLARGE